MDFSLIPFRLLNYKCNARAACIYIYFSRSVSFRALSESKYIHGLGSLTSFIVIHIYYFFSKTCFCCCYCSFSIMGFFIRICLMSCGFDCCVSSLWFFFLFLFSYMDNFLLSAFSCLFLFFFHPLINFSSTASVFISYSPLIFRIYIHLHVFYGNKSTLPKTDRVPIHKKKSYHIMFNEIETETEISRPNEIEKKTALNRYI